MDESSQVEEIEFVVSDGGQTFPYNTYIVERYDLNPPKIFEVDQWVCKLDYKRGVCYLLDLSTIQHWKYIRKNHL